MRAAIIGVFNSGSSVTSQIVERLGAEIGRPLWGNFYESRILKTLLEDWWGLPKLVEQVGREHRVPFFRWWAEHHETMKPVVCAKHPLLCMSAADLDEAWGPNYKAIRASRPLQKSVERLAARNWFQQPERIQHTLYDACEDYFREKEHLDIQFEDLLHDPVTMTRQIADYLGLDSSEDNVAQAASVVVQRSGGK